MSKMTGAGGGAGGNGAGPGTGLPNDSAQKRQNNQNYATMSEDHSSERRKRKGSQESKQDSAEVNNIGKELMQSGKFGQSNNQN